ncbi:hypothetical protein DQ04_00041230 [Trypanosoma grayi]|uniref:hypothetical protein n=1 Tax=Trypanosoma grayi TaxID=71804 RepID=UPI0004F3FF8A|nr:hypothetical protein DQ04_00041230 [Trypanosoma grayi]KEG15559.1 hypothetical protein DQ04_00041230 [Trypanosoma grayi]
MAAVAQTSFRLLEVERSLAPGLGRLQTFDASSLALAHGHEGHGLSFCLFRISPSLLCSFHSSWQHKTKEVLVSSRRTNVHAHRQTDRQVLPAARIYKKQQHTVTTVQVFRLVACVAPRAAGRGRPPFY